MKNTFLCCLLFLGFFGCSTVGGLFPANKAIVNDCASKLAVESGYRIAEVDGKAAERARSGVVTVVPFVLAEPGEREFTLETRGGNDLPRVKVKATVVAGRRYVVKKDGESVVIAEEEIK
jgi:hypothetical protein